MPRASISLRTPTVLGRRRRPIPPFLARRQRNFDEETEHLFHRRSPPATPEAVQLFNLVRGDGDIDLLHDRHHHRRVIMKPEASDTPFQAYQPLRRRLERRLGRPVNDSLWQALAASGYLARYRGMGEVELDEQIEDLVYYYEDFETVFNHLPHQSGSGAQPIVRRPPPGSPPDNVIRRAEAFSQFLASLARDDPEVTEFRQQVLGGRRLAEEEARRLLESPVLALLPWATFLARDVPRPPLEIDSLVAVEGGDIAHGGMAKFVLTGDAVDGRVELLVSDRAWRHLHYTGQDGWTKRVLVAPGSVLGHLQMLASRLAKQYPWQEGQAACFILTGAPPFVSPATWRLSGQFTPLFAWAVLTLEVEPWVPPKLLMESYRGLQRQLGITKGLSARTTHLVSFLAQHVTYHPRAPNPLELPSSWRKLMAMWNQSCPAPWRYRDPRRFERDCLQALERVVFKRRLWDRWPQVLNK